MLYIGDKMKHQHRRELIEQAKLQPPVWTGNLEDDCTSRWGGLLLRAEWMSGENWWWAVSEIATDLQVDSSNNREDEVDSGLLARRLAEAAACEHLGLSSDYTNS